MARTGARSVDLVGNSAGGIVARLWVADGGADLTRRVISSAPPTTAPHWPTLPARCRSTPARRRAANLATDSDVLRRLNAGDETPTGPTWVSIWTDQDQTVTPPDTARLDGAINVPVQSVCADSTVGHGDLHSTPLVQAMVLAELGAGAPVPLTAADCLGLRQG